MGTTAMSCPLCGGGSMRVFVGDERFLTQRCRSCSYLLTGFRPGRQAAGDYYESVVDEEAFERSVGAVRAEQTEAVLDALAEHGVTQGKLLDIGCGYGFMLRAARARGFDVSGIEPSEAWLRAAAVPGARVAHGLYPEAGFPEERFDAITAIDVIEHIPLHLLDPFLEAVHGSLAPRGLFAVKVPDSDGLVFRGTVWAHRLSGGRVHGPLDRMLQLNYGHPHVSYFDRTNLTRYLAARGFEVVDSFRHPEVSPRTAWSRVEFENPPPLPARIAYAGALVALWMAASLTGWKDALVLVLRSVR